MVNFQKKKIFLGGSTIKLDNWRDNYIKELTNLDCFNPVVKNWSKEDQLIEKKHRENDDLLLFCLNGPNLFSIAEVVDCSNKRNKETILIIDIDKIKKSKSARIKSMYAIGEMVENNGSKVFYNHKDCIKYLKQF